MLALLCYILIPLGIVALDQLTKYLTVVYLKPVEEISLIPEVLHLQYVENRGAAFGSFQGQMVLFYLITLVMLGFLVMMLRRNWVRGRYGRTVVLCLVGGALGNFIDRVRLGYVVDMIAVKFIRFPVFNVADVFLTCGCVALAVYFIFFDEKLQTAANREHAAPETKEDADGNDPS